MRYFLFFIYFVFFSEYTFAEDKPTYSGTLPVLFINTEGGQAIVSKENYINATCYIDALGIEGYESLARYYVLSEAIDHIEAFQGSCYMYKDLNEKKWKFGPVWDLGHAFNGFHSKQKYIYDYPEWNHCIIEEIVKFPRFQEYVKKVWREFCIDIYPKMNQFIDDFVNEIEIAAKYNAARWPQYGNADERAAAEIVKQRFSEKIQWLSPQWGDYTSIDEKKVDTYTKTPNRYDLSGRRINNNHFHQIIIDSKGKYINKTY